MQSLTEDLPTTDKATNEKTLLEVKNLKKYFPIKKGFLSKTVGHVKAVDDVSFTVGKGKTYSLVGESGCGKTTTGRSLLRLIEPTSGAVKFAGTDLLSLNNKEMQKIRQKMQIIFQDPFSSLNPRHTVGNTVTEGLEIHYKLSKNELSDKRSELLERVSLRPEHANRYPHEFSGGQRQRIAIARALALSPEFIVCDESVSALDVSIQAQIINLLQDLQSELGLSYLFIAHDLAVVRHISDRVGVMYLGKIMEEADSEEIFNNPLHPYTQALLSAVPEINAKNRKTREILSGELPSAINPPSGCPFRTRCPKAKSECAIEPIPTTAVSATHKVRCILYS